MKSKTYADGSAIAQALVYKSSMHPDTNANLETYGRLYTWYSAVNVPENSTTLPTRGTKGYVQGVCPDGWHIPTVNEMANLNTYSAEELKSTELWLYPNNNTNSTIFSSLPAGIYTKTLDYFEGLLGQTYYWSDSLSTAEYAVACEINYYCNTTRHEKKLAGDAISVRCLRDEYGGTTAVLPTVTTGQIVSDITATTAIASGNVIADNGSEVTARGVCYSTEQNPTINDSHTTEGAGIGNFSSTLTNLTSGATYYVRAYATNSFGTAYGDVIQFTTLRTWQHCTDMPTVTDHEGNVYNTVQIGNQCWTRENMRTVTSPSTGKRLVNPNNFSIDTALRSYTSKVAYWYLNDSATYAPKNFGLLYNWCAAVDTFRPGYPEVATIESTGSTSYWSCTFPANHRRGICPQGWHIPSDADWMQLIDYVKSQNNYLCDNNTSNIAKALSSTEFWETSTNTCAVGNNPSDNDATGFALVPAGYCNVSFFYAGTNTYLWSSTQTSTSQARNFNLSLNDAELHRNAVLKQYPRSVRCLRD